MAQKEFRHFAATWNNYQKVDNWQQILIDCYTKLDANYLIAAHEIAPSTGTPHLQIYIQLNKKKYFTTITKCLPGCHITKVNGSSQDNITYCNKVDENPIIYGTIRDIGRGRAKQARDWELILNLAKVGQLDRIEQEHPMEFIVYYNALNKIATANRVVVSKERTCLWLYGNSGVGKSRVCHFLWPDAYWKNANKWWDGYNTQREVILDDLGTDHLAEHLKRWADRYKCTLEVKGGSVSADYDVFVVTSNFHPRELFKECEKVTVDAICRRFDVMHIESFDGNECLYTVEGMQGMYDLVKEIKPFEIDWD